MVSGLVVGYCWYLWWIFSSNTQLLEHQNAHPPPQKKVTLWCTFWWMFFFYKESLPADLGAGQHDGTKRHGFYFRILSWRIIPSLKLTAIAPEIGAWKMNFLLGQKAYLQGLCQVYRECMFFTFFNCQCSQRALFHVGWSLGANLKMSP